MSSVQVDLQERAAFLGESPRKGLGSAINNLIPRMCRPNGNSEIRGSLRESIATMDAVVYFISEKVEGMHLYLQLRSG